MSYESLIAGLMVRSPVYEGEEFVNVPLHVFEDAITLIRKVVEITNRYSLDALGSDNLSDQCGTDLKVAYDIGFDDGAARVAEELSEVIDNA